MTNSLAFAVIGGSGLYAMQGLTDTQEVSPETPFGKPSSPIVLGTLEGQRVAFLARHGLGHFIPPTEVNYRANIYALKQLGADRIISISACGSLREDYAPGHIVIPDQLFDFTKDRERSFFGQGLVAHVGVAEPFCPHLGRLMLEAIQKTGAIVHNGGTLITVEGPRFSTKAESHAFRAWGMSIIGMTASPEAFLAREAEICYTTLAHITDYDVWHGSAQPVTVEMVITTLSRNTAAAQDALRNLAHVLTPERSCTCGSALANAIITNPTVIAPATRQKLDLLVGKYLK
ncbi:MAG: S-methyl-5'-thioadenosine phosphorylase [Anaerolineae bacterium CG_4_9_14_3_um_filter_57_17]|nr:S-methyl-5'-thioadenosine phosphorylase [bacterium]NCT20558.1 S-methyl-5'-thioadenosine phosphorylase [bacterium]OIO86325.1 MAG: methylthioadenosine phosphorylase [Anaerolineae bacterium CG2_30_57_67]PJB64857.1 MAG: S-methyl-5'-thioadenosine phosphorylase [Anaerolineae bacterium CG_4_9_14_3_um_filter_57_17]